MTFSHIVHHMTKAPDAQAYAYKITRVTPITRLCCMGESILLQGGRVFSSGGDEIPEPPGWFYDQIARLSVAALKEVGFDKVPDRPASAIDVKPNLMQCPECHKLIEPAHLRDHIAKHNRKAGAAEQMENK